MLLHIFTTFLRAIPFLVIPQTQTNFFKIIFPFAWIKYLEN